MPGDLFDIGQTLRRAREERGLSLTSVSRDLCLRREVVEAVEQGDWSALPHIIYVKGYVKRYGDLVGVTAGGLLMPDAPSPSVSESSPPPRAPKLSRRSAYAVFASSLLLVLVLLSFLLPARPPVTAVGRVNGPVLSPVRGTAPAAKELTILCHERTWIRVLVDGREKREFILNPRDAVVMRAEEHFVLLVGNAGGVRLFLNGSDTCFFGESGEVKKVFLS